jgi:hypothetical protein
MSTDLVLAWAAEKGLKIAADRLLAELLRPANSEEVVLAEIRTISSKLDAIIDAPFKEATFHLKAGDRALGKEKLIQAVALNRYDLAARALLARLYIEDDRLDIALDLYVEMIEATGLRSDLLPLSLVEAYQAKLSEFPLAGPIIVDPVIIHIEDHHPEAIWLSQQGVAIMWTRRTFLYPKHNHTVTFTPWTTWDFLIDTSVDHPHLALVISVQGYRLN